MGKELTRISLVVAFSLNRVIGRDGGMPWKLSEDLKRFRDITMDKPVVMGRKTFESIGKPLPGRTTIVVTSANPASFPEGVVVVDSFDRAIEVGRDIAWDKQVGEICVIGGGQIYKQAMEHATNIYATHVLANIEGDTHFPVILDDVWEISIERPGAPVDEKNSHPTKYVSYHRR